MVETRSFGTLPEGGEARLFLLSNGGITVKVSDFGATLVGIEVPDASGDVADVMLGFDDVSGYAGDDPACFGCTIGPSANRVAGGEVVVDGVPWQLERNENGANNLHTDLAHGLHKRLWAVRHAGDAEDGAAEVLLSCELGHGELGLPGNRTVRARYSLSPDGVLTLTYCLKTDAPTFANITNHGYFNLSGHASGSVEGQLVQMPAARFVAIGAGSIPTGELREVEGTPFDFRRPRALGEGLGAEDDQIQAGTGYDHCFVVDGYEPDAAPRPALHAEDPASGRTLDVRVTTPGVQLYTGNWLGDEGAKDGASYAPHAGFAVEPEFYPDVVHHPSWPQPVCTPEHPFRSVIQYEFGIRSPR